MKGAARHVTSQKRDSNKALVQASFDRWKSGTGGPFELLAPDAEWTDAEATVRDRKSYRNTYTWYFQMRGAKVVKAIAFFDNRDFDEFWNRVSPKP
jgi:uncharacterized protein